MKKTIIAALLTAATFGLTGCGDSTGDINQVSGQQGNPAAPQPTPPAPNEPQLRLAMMALEYEGLDVLVNGTEVQTDADAGDITNYFEVPSGQSRIQVRRAGTDVDLLSQNVSLSDDNFHTVVVTGIETDDEVAVLGQAIEGVRLLSLTDDVTPTANTVSVRFVNAIPFEEGNDASLRTPEDTVIAGPQDPNSASGYVSFNAALNFDFLFLVLPEAGETWRYETEEGTNQPIFDAIAEAVGEAPANLSIFIVGDGGDIPAFVTIDEASGGGETYIFQGEREETGFI